MSEQYKLLLVDDELHIREVATRFLKRHLKVSITEIDNGLDAVEAVKKLQYDLMLLDINIPGCDGWEVIRRVREFNPTIKIIVVTAQTELSPEQKLLVAQTSGFYSKPIHLPTLMQYIGAAVGEDIAYDPVEVRPDDLKGRREAREIMHGLKNLHHLARIHLEGFILDHNGGYMKDKTQEEIIFEAKASMEKAMKALDMCKPVVEQIRKL